MSEPVATSADAALPTSYEAARTELAGIVRALESGGQSLEESLALWERGEALAALCGTWLEAARDRLATATGSGSETGDTPPRRPGS